jgi:hypothetical protein
LLEFVLVSGFISLFFLWLYFKLGENAREFEEKNDGSPAPFIDQLNRFSCISLGILALFIGFYFGMVGEPARLIVTNNTFTNWTSVNGTVPVIASYSQASTSSFSDGQMLLITGVFSVMQWIAFLFTTIFVVTLVVRMVSSAQSKWQKRQSGDFDE